MVEAFKDFFMIIANTFTNILNHFNAWSSWPFVVKIIVSLLIMIIVFFAGHYFWNISSWIPTNIVVTYLMYHMVDSKIALIVMWITFIPWCFFIRDKERQQLPFDFKRDIEQKHGRYPFEFHPIVINRVIRLLSVIAFNGIIYFMLYNFLFENAVSDGKFNDIKYVIGAIIVFLILVISTGCQSYNTFDNPSLLFDNNILVLLGKPIDKEYKSLSLDMRLDMLFDKEFKILMVFIIIRILTWLVIMCLFIVRINSGQANMGGVNILFPLICLVHDIRCIIMNIYIRNME